MGRSIARGNGETAVHQKQRGSWDGQLLTTVDEM